jgi:hypothetical protein
MATENFSFTPQIFGLIHPAAWMQQKRDVIILPTGFRSDPFFCSRLINRNWWNGILFLFYQACLSLKIILSFTFWDSIVFCLSAS